jgi:hypothetical protein
MAGSGFGSSNPSLRHTKVKSWRGVIETPGADATVIVGNAGISPLEGDSWMSSRALRSQTESERVAIFWHMTSPSYPSSSNSKHFEVLTSFQSRIPKTVERY